MPNSEDKELIKNVRTARNEHGQLLISSICQKLQESGFNISDTLVSYYSPIEEMYIFVAKEPIPPEKDGIAMDNLQKNRLMLRFRNQKDTAKGASMMDSSQISQPQAGKDLFL